MRLSLYRSRREYSCLTPVYDGLIGLHSFTALPWWCLIPATTAGISLLTLPIALQSRRQQRRIADLAPLLAARKLERDRRSTITSIKEIRRLDKLDRKKVHARHGVSLYRILALPALRIPIWIAFSSTLRSMSGLPILFEELPFEVSLKDEGIGWIADLTQYDTLLILPFSFGLINLLNIEINAREGRLSQVISHIMRGASIAMIFIGAQMPASVCLYWTTSASIALMQNIAFKVLDAHPKK